MKIIAALPKSVLPQPEACTKPCKTMLRNVTTECRHAPETVLRDLQNLLRWAVTMLQKRKLKLGELKPMFTSKVNKHHSQELEPKGAECKEPGTHSATDHPVGFKPLGKRGQFQFGFFHCSVTQGKSPHHTRFWGHSLPADVRARHMTSPKETQHCRAHEVLKSENLSGNDICLAGDPATQLLSSHPSCRL